MGRFAWRPGEGARVASNVVSREVVEILDGGRRRGDLDRGHRDGLIDDIPTCAALIFENRE